VLVAYVSGHGFGHATRTAEVLRAVRNLAPDLPLTVVSAAPEWLFRAAVPGPLSFRSATLDVGVVQSDALTMDEAATAARWRQWSDAYPRRLDEEAGWLRRAGARVVLGDVPPLAFDAAAEAGVPSVALANFSWDWIYRHLGRAWPDLRRAAAHSARAYARCGLLLELPFGGHLGAFPRREAVPFVARRSRVPGEETRRRLGLAADRPAVLLSFGGLGLGRFDAAALSDLEGYAVLGPQGLSPEVLAGHGLRYEDVVAAADVVVSKPGYGIVTDAIAGRTRLVYTDRGDFPEYAVLVEQMPRYLPVAYVSNQDLRAGRLRAALAEVAAAPFPPAPDLGGAEAAARRLLS
jgi:hypothetical protein